MTIISVVAIVKFMQQCSKSKDKAVDIQNDNSAPSNQNFSHKSLD
jgi:hypothetical protein